LFGILLPDMTQVSKGRILFSVGRSAQKAHTRFTYGAKKNDFCIYYLRLRIMARHTQKQYKPYFVARIFHLAEAERDNTSRLMKITDIIRA